MMHSVLPEVATITWLARWESLLPMHLLPWGTSYSPMKGGEVTSSGGRFLAAFGVAEASDSTDFLPTLSRLERAALSPQGTRRSSDSGSSIGARVAQMCVGQPCTPSNVVWKGGLVRNLPYRDQRRGCAKPSTIRTGSPRSILIDNS